MGKVKVNFTIEEHLLEDLDTYCDDNYLSRSTVISQAVLQVVNQQKMIDSMRDASIAVRKAAELGTIDEDTQKALDGFEALAKLYIRK